MILTPDSEPIPRSIAKEIVSRPTKFIMDADFKKEIASSLSTNCLPYCSFKRHGCWSA